MPKIRGVKPDYWTDEDVCEVSIPARLLFIGLWNYSCDNGHMQDKPKQIKRRILPDDDINVSELLRELASSELIERAEGWITTPNLTKHQRPDKRYWQTCDKAGCERPAADSKPGTRGGHNEPTPSPQRAPDVGSMGPHVDGDCDGDGELKVMVTESRELALVGDDRADVTRICNHLADRIEGNGAKRPSVGKTWHTAARLMLDNDGRTEEEIHGAIDWCQSDEFWRSNVLSMPKLREKYDTLRLQAQRSPRTSKQDETNALFDRAMARARAMGADE